MNHSKITVDVFLGLLISICFNISSLANHLDSKQKRSKFVLKDICLSLISWHFSEMDHFHTYAFHENILSWPLSEFHCLPRPSLRQQPYYKTENSIFTKQSSNYTVQGNFASVCTNSRADWCTYILQMHQTYVPAYLWKHCSFRNRNVDNFFVGLQFTDYAKSSTNDITIDVFYLSQTIGGI